MSWIDQITHRWDQRAWEELTYWALDLETTELSHKTGEICSVGMVPIRQGVITWGERVYFLVDGRKASHESLDSLRVHKLLQSERETGLSLAQAYQEISSRVADNVLVVHHASLDTKFLRHAALEVQQPALRVPVVDTQRLVQRLNDRHQWLGKTPIPLGLRTARDAFGLAAYPEHHALYDAHACAELMLVLRARLDVSRGRQLFTDRS